MQKITTFLTFNHQAEAAAQLYTSLFKNSAITHISRYPKHVPEVGGSAISVNFQLDGQEFYALNGGPTFAFADGISLFVHCETQEEVDFFWEKLSEGGSKGQCGWLKDPFGVSWQIVPNALGRLLQGNDPAKSNRVMAALRQMTKLDIKGLEAAANG